jgi:hypothetical protein
MRIFTAPFLFALTGARHLLGNVWGEKAHIGRDSAQTLR